MRVTPLLFTLIACLACAGSEPAHEPKLVPEWLLISNAKCLGEAAEKYASSDIDSTLLAETIGLKCSEGLEEVIFSDYPDAEADFVNRRLTVFGAAALTTARNKAKSTADE